MILVRWSGLMLNSSHQLGLLQQLKVTDPRALCAVVGFSKMSDGTDILHVPLIYDGLKIISVLSSFKRFQAQVIKETNTLKYLLCKVVRVNSTAEGFFLKSPAIPLSLSCAQLFKLQFQLAFPPHNYCVVDVKILVYPQQHLCSNISYNPGLPTPKQGQGFRFRVGILLWPISASAPGEAENATMRGISQCGEELGSMWPEENVSITLPKTEQPILPVAFTQHIFLCHNNRYIFNFLMHTGIFFSCFFFQWHGVQK